MRGTRVAKFFRCDVDGELVPPEAGTATDALERYQERLSDNVPMNSWRGARHTCYLRRHFMEPSKYDNPEQPLATTLGTTLGGEAIPVEGVRSDDPRRASREPLPGEENLAGKSGPGPKVMAADTLDGDDIVNAAGEKLGT